MQHFGTKRRHDFLTRKIPDARMIMVWIITFEVFVAARVPGSVATVSAAGAQPSAIIRREFIFEVAPFPQCHASTIVESENGTLVAAWFGGTREKHPDVGIWVSRKADRQWTAPVEVANGVQSTQERHPCWNPVLFQPRKGALMLFFKVGPSPRSWWGELMISNDGGKTWNNRSKLPDGGTSRPIQHHAAKGGILDLVNGDKPHFPAREMIILFGNWHLSEPMRVDRHRLL